MKFLGSTILLPVAHSLYINEVFVQRALDGFDSVEFYNPSDSAVQLQGYFFRDDVSKTLAADLEKKTFRFGDETVPSKGYLVVELNAETATFGLGSDDRVSLYNSDEVLLDEVRWKPGEASDGLSWSRCGLPGSDDPFAFQTTDPTLGGANNCATIATYPVDGVVILNEVYNKNISVAVDGQLDWVEVYNPSPDKPAKMDGWTLTDSQKAFVSSKKFPAGLVIPPLSYYILVLDPFQGDKALGSNDEVHLFDGMAFEQDEVHWTIESNPAGNIIKRCPAFDQSTDWIATSEVTKGADNNCAQTSDQSATSDLVINEVVSDWQQGDMKDWVEIHNVGTTAVDITRWSVGDASARFATDRIFLGDMDALTGLQTTMLQPNEYRIASGSRFSRTGEDSAKLYRPDGTLVAATSYTNATYPASGQAWVRCPAAGGGVEYIVTDTPTREGANNCIPAPIKKAPTPALSPASSAGRAGRAGMAMIAIVGSAAFGVL